MREQPLLMAQIAGVHGVRGQVKLKVFGDNAQALPDYGALTDAEGKRDFKITEVALHGNIWIAAIEGVNDRTAAEKLFGTRLYMTRDRLPRLKKKNTYYHADLIGMAAQYPDGKPMGKVLAVANFGAGDLLEIKPSKGGSFYIPFTDSAVPEVDVEKNLVTIDPPSGLLD